MEARANSDLSFIGMWNISFIIMWPLHNQSYCNISMKNGSNVIIVTWTVIIVIFSRVRRYKYLDNKLLNVMYVPHQKIHWFGVNNTLVVYGVNLPNDTNVDLIHDTHYTSGVKAHRLTDQLVIFVHFSSPLSLDVTINTNSAIFHLYHVEYKLIFNNMMMRSVLY